jgi:spore maturation protein CgeB
LKIVIFGLTISSSWGNGHATLWRGLCRALIRRGHRIVFYERDVPYYASARDLTDLPGMELALYADFAEVRARAQRDADEADAAFVTSYCPDGIEASEVTLASRASIKVFYDLDTPVTLAALDAGRELSYIGAGGLADFDLVLSYTGGRALDELEQRLGARRVEVLFGHVDPDLHRPVPPLAQYRSELSYLGTYAADRQQALEELFFKPAAQHPDRAFLLGGSMFPETVRWPANVRHLAHVPPPDHPAFFCSSRLTLNVTRSAMAEMGYCPSGRLFEAAACGVPLLSDYWEGLELFYTPGTELLVGRTQSDTIDALNLSDRELARIAEAARDRTLTRHTASTRALELERMLEPLEAGESARRSRIRLTEAEV